MNCLIILIVTLAFSHAELKTDTTTISQLSEELLLATGAVPQENLVPTTFIESSYESSSSLKPELSSKLETHYIQKVSEPGYEVPLEEFTTVLAPEEPVQSVHTLIPDPSTHVIVVNNVPTIDQNATIVHQENVRRADGSYKYGYDTSNGILFHEEGVPRNFNKTDVNSGNPVRNIVVTGAFGWTAPDGQKINVKYYADETGYHPEGDVLPTPPPSPPEILRALARIRKVEAAKKEKELKSKDQHSDN